MATGPVLGEGLLASRPLLIAVVEFEWFLGLWMLAGLYPKRTWQVALACFSAFACVSFYKGLDGEASCGCFGQVEVSPWYTLTLDLAAVLGLLVWAPRECVSDGAAARTFPAPVLGFSRVGTVLAAALLVGVPGAAAMATYRPTTLGEDGMILGPGNVVVLEPEKWVGKRFPLLPYIENYPGRLAPGERPLGERLREGNWIVVLYHHDCPNCLAEMPKYEQLARHTAADPTAPRVVLIEVPPYGDANSVELVFNAPCALGRLSDEKEWLVETPVEVAMQGMFVDPAGRSDTAMSQHNFYASSGGM